MAKKTKKLLAVLMAAFMCLTVQLPSFAAEEDGYFYDFNTDFPNQFKVANDDFPGAFESHSWEGTSDEAWGNSVKYTNVAKNEQVVLSAGSTYDSYAVEYSFRIDKADNTFHTDFRQDDEDLYVVKMNHNLNVELFNTPVAQYELEKWYDVKIWFDASTRHVLFLMKESSDTTWNAYESVYVNSDADVSGTTALHFEYHQGKDDEGGVMYIDNLKAFPYTESEKISLLLSCYGDNFENGINYNETVTNYAKYWRVMNQNYQTQIVAEPLDGYEGNVLKLKDISSDTSEVNLTLGKYPFNAETIPNARQKINFKIGSNFDSGKAGVYVKFRDPQTDSLSEANILSLYEGKIVMGDAAEGAVFDDASIAAKKLYDAEFIYDANESVAALTVYGDDNSIYASFLDMGFFGGKYGLLDSIEFVCSSSGQSETYVDDFVWSVNDAVFGYEDYTIMSDMQDTADINETVIFNFNDIIAEDNIPEVKVTKDGVMVKEPYTIQIKGKSVQIAFENLEKEAKYTVGISGIECLFGGKADSETAELTTADYTVEVQSFSVDDGTVTAELKGAYAGDFTSFVAACAYDAEGNIIEVQLHPVEVPYRDYGEVIFKPSFEKEYSSFSAMVIKDFDSAVSYSGNIPSSSASVSDTEANTGYEALTEIEIDGDSFVVKGQNVSKKDSVVTLQVLKPGRTWNELSDFDYENDDITEILASFDSVADAQYGQTYSFIQKLYDSQIPAFRVRFGEGLITYYDPVLMEDINKSQTADELESVAKSNSAVWDDMESCVDALDEKEQEAFWQHLLEIKNALSDAGTPFTLPAEFSGSAPGVSALARLSLAQGVSAVEELFADFRAEGVITGNSYDIYAGEGDFDKYGMPDSQKSSFLKHIYSSINGYVYAEDFTQDFNINAILYAISGGSKGAVDAIISGSDLIDADKIPTYFELSSEKRRNVCEKIGSNKLYTSIDALLEDVESISENEKSAKENPVGGSGGGSGKSSATKGKSFVSITEEDDSKVADISFTDIENVKWAKEAITALANAKIVEGYGNGVFGPDKYVTREEFVKMLVLTLKITTGNMSESFDDIDSSDWCQPYVCAAVNSGVVKGIDADTFGKGKVISREEMATMTYRALCAKGISLGGDGKEEFADASSISPWAAESCRAMQGAGIINGMGDNRFAPGEYVTRAQAAKVLYEAMSK